MHHQMKKHILYILTAGMLAAACEKLELPTQEEKNETENTIEQDKDSIEGDIPTEPPYHTPTINDTIAYIQNHGNTPETAYSVRDFKTYIPTYLSLTQGAIGWHNVYVTGYIVGHTPPNAHSIEKTVFGTGNVETNIVIADSPQENHYSNCIAIELTKSSTQSTETRNALNLSSNPQNLHRKVTIFGNIEPYKKALGIKNARKHIFH